MGWDVDVAPWVLGVGRMMCRVAVTLLWTAGLLCVKRDLSDVFFLYVWLVFLISVIANECMTTSRRDTSVVIPPRWFRMECLFHVVCLVTIVAGYDRIRLDAVVVAEAAVQIGIVALQWYQDSGVSPREHELK